MPCCWHQALFDAVGAGGGDRDQAQRGQLGEGFGAQRHLVGDGDGGAGEALDELLGLGLGVDAQLVGAGGRAQADLRREGRAVEKDDLVHGAPLIFLRQPWWSRWR